MSYSKIITVTRKKYSNRAMIYAIVIGLFFLVLDKKNVCRGIILGSIFSVVNFLLISRSLRSRIGKTKKKVLLLSMTNMFIRYFSMALPLFIAIKLDRFDIFGVAAGLFTVQFAILTDQLPWALHKH